MPPKIPYWQFVGRLVGAAFFIFVGAWCLSIRRQIDRGKIDAFDGLTKLRKGSLFGYMFVLIAIGDVVGTLNQIRAFGDSFGGVVFGAFAIGVLAFSFVQKRKLNL